MGLWECFDSRARRLGIVDTKLALGAAMFLALTIAKLVPEILSVSVWWFVVLWIGLGVRPLLVYFGSGPRERRSSGSP